MDERVMQQAEPRSKKPAAIILIYTLGGPPISGFLAVAVIVIATLLENGGTYWMSNLQDEPLLTILSIPGIAVGGVFFGYLFGGIFAFLTGLLIAAFASNKRNQIGYVTAFMAASFVGSALVAIIVAGFYLDGAELVEGVEWLLASYVAVGAVTSLVLRFLFRKRFARSGAI